MDNWRLGLGQKKSDFDEIAYDYKNLVSKNTEVVNGNSDYLNKYKVEIASQVKANPGKILDFGCGIGLSQKYLQEYFPFAEIFACDESRESLKILSNMHPNTKIISNEDIYKRDQKFDMIFISCVLHHVEQSQRELLLSLLVKALNANGKLVIFEHNPLNPITQAIVKNSPIDAGVILLRRSQLYKMLRNSFNALAIESGYTVFFPDFLSKLRFLERHLLKRVPIGAQYYVVATKL